MITDKQVREQLQKLIDDEITPHEFKKSLGHHWTRTYPDNETLTYYEGLYFIVADDPDIDGYGDEGAQHRVYLSSQVTQDGYMDYDQHWDDSTPAETLTYGEQEWLKGLLECEIVGGEDDDSRIATVVLRKLHSIYESIWANPNEDEEEQ